MMLFRSLLLLQLLYFSLYAAKIETFYGEIEVEEPVLLELIESPSFQRLKCIHQYGVAYYTNYHEEYTRYDHSLGVFAILRLKNASLEEQIAGLLHDVSHTVFSHVGDWIFEKQNQESDYQNSIHKKYLESSGLGKILNKYQYTVDQMLPLEKFFPMLEQKGPDLCADRIEYNVQGAFHQGIITQEEALKVVEDLRFIEGSWVGTNSELLTKVARFSLMMTQQCWGSAANYLLSQWLAKAILRGIDLKVISYDDIHFGKDQSIWDLLISSSDELIQEKMDKIASPESYYCVVDPSEADIVVKSKFRGINPWIFKEGKKVRLTDLDKNYCEEYEQVKVVLEKDGVSSL